jgi:acetyl esterase/lipase
MEQRMAVLLLRPRTGEVSAGVTWPVAVGRARAVALLLAPDRFGSTSRAECAAALANASEAVVVDLRCADTGPRSVDDASYTLCWLADHAAELGADADEVLMVSVPAAAATAWAVTARARADGWPPVTWRPLLDESAASAESFGHRD